MSTDVVVRAPFDVKFSVSSDAPHAFASIPLLSPSVVAAEIALVSPAASAQAVELVSVELAVRRDAKVAIVSAVGATVQEAKIDAGDTRGAATFAPKVLQPLECHSCLFRLQPTAMAASTTR